MTIQECVAILDKEFPITTPCITLARGKQHPGKFCTITKLIDGEFVEYEIQYQGFDKFHIIVTDHYGKSKWLASNWDATLDMIRQIMAY